MSEYYYKYTENSIKLISADFIVGRIIFIGKLIWLSDIPLYIKTSKLFIPLVR